MKKTLIFKRIYLGIGVIVVIGFNIASYLYIKSDDVYIKTNSGIVESKDQIEQPCGRYHEYLCKNYTLTIKGQTEIVTKEAFDAAVVGNYIGLSIKDEKASRNLFLEVIVGISFIANLVLALMIVCLIFNIIKWSVTKADEMSLNQYLKKYFW